MIINRQDSKDIKDTKFVYIEYHSVPGVLAVQLKTQAQKLR